MSKLILWLVRHGQSTANMGIWNSKPETISLNKTGERQAYEIADQVNTKPDMIIVSPFKRAQQTAQPLIQRWPDVRIETWPIQEFTYLDPKKYESATRLQRKAAILSYWKRLDPFFCDGEGVECFSDFIQRLENFHQRITEKTGYIVVFGHGQFFKAYQIGLREGFAATHSWMEEFRAEEKADPLKNGEIIKLYLV